MQYISEDKILAHMISLRGLKAQMTVWPNVFPVPISHYFREFRLVRTIAPATQSLKIATEEKLEGLYWYTSSATCFKDKNDFIPDGENYRSGVDEALKAERPLIFLETLQSGVTIKSGP